MRELFRWQTTTIAIVGVHFDGDSSKLPSGSGLLERKNAICDILLTVILVISAGTKCEWRLIRLMTAADALLRGRDRFLRPDRLDDVARAEPRADSGSGRSNGMPICTMFFGKMRSRPQSSTPLDEEALWLNSDPTRNVRYENDKAILECYKEGRSGTAVRIVLSWALGLLYRELALHIG